MTRRRKRLVLIGLLMVGVAAAAMLALTAFQQNLLYFFSPSQVAAGEAPPDYPFRLGGLVAAQSVERVSGSLDVRFQVTDGNRSIPVTYTGVLPDLFREGQGVVAHGQLDADGVFRADQVLAKHDEEYMPPEVKKALQVSDNGTDPSRHASGGEP
ncbi:MAG: cytochrome c maturation protein CcmE [Nitrococcus mobilis]|nr:cytochrome c maturation protein CcmE [Nitrococcus mobilis]